MQYWREVISRRQVIVTSDVPTKAPVTGDAEVSTKRKRTKPFPL